MVPAAMVELVKGACLGANASTGVKPPKLVFGDTLGSNGMPFAVLEQICDEIVTALYQGTDLKDGLVLETSEALHPSFQVMLK